MKNELCKVKISGDMTFGVVCDYGHDDRFGDYVTYIDSQGNILTRYSDKYKYSKKLKIGNIVVDMSVGDDEHVMEVHAAKKYELKNAKTINKNYLNDLDNMIRVDDRISKLSKIIPNVRYINVLKLLKASPLCVTKRSIVRHCIERSDELHEEEIKFAKNYEDTLREIRRRNSVVVSGTMVPEKDDLSSRVVRRYDKIRESFNGFKINKAGVSIYLSAALLVTGMFVSRGDTPFVKDDKKSYYQLEINYDNGSFIGANKTDNTYIAFDTIYYDIDSYEKNDDGEYIHYVRRHEKGLYGNNKENDKAMMDAVGLTKSSTTSVNDIPGYPVKQFENKELEELYHGKVVKDQDLIATFEGKPVKSTVKVTICVKDETNYKLVKESDSENRDDNVSYLITLGLTELIIGAGIYSLSEDNKSKSRKKTR